MSKAIVFYTSNREDPELEQMIRDNLQEVAGDVPIVSVSQKPIDFGKNICVGERGNTYLNAYRQLLIGCKQTDADFIFTAEADCLYPKGYFDFEPTDPNVVYTYDQVYILWKFNGPFRKKEQTHATVVYGRQFLINLLEKSLKGLPEWSDKKIGFPWYTDEKFVEFTGDPVITLKTGNGVQKSSFRMQGSYKELPHWGTPADIRRKMWKE